jgi:hypothetical protein
MCAFGPYAPLAALWGWREMFEVLAGATQLVGVVRPHPFPAFGTQHSLFSVLKRLLDGDLYWLAVSCDHTIIENRFHFALRSVAPRLQDRTLLGFREFRPISPFSKRGNILPAD